MRKFDNDLLRRIVIGAIRNHNDSHPDLAVRPEAFTSIAKRAARTIFIEFRKRFGDLSNKDLESRIASGVDHDSEGLPL